MEPTGQSGMTHIKAKLNSKDNLLARDWIAGLERGLAVMESFDENYSRMTAHQVGERCGLSRTAARRYLLTLQHLGFVSTDNKLYWLTPRVMRLGQAYLASARLPRIVQPVLQSVAVALQEVCYLAVLDAGEVVYVSRNGPNRAMNSGFVLGARVPSHVTSAGLLLLAHLSSDQLEDWIQTHHFSVYTSFTISNPDELRTELKKIRQQGWSLSEQQFDLSIRGIAVPLKNSRGDLMGALSIQMSIQNESADAALQRVVPVLQKAAQSLRDVI